MARRSSAAIVYADHATYPAIADLTADFVYARLMGCAEEEETGYPPAALDAWAARLRAWAKGGEPQDLPRVAAPVGKPAPRDCFVYFISGAKERNPAAAMALLRHLGS